MSKGSIGFGATVMMLVVAAAVTAHHGTLINYDRSKQWTAKVVVTEFRYVNPHAQLFFESGDVRIKQPRTFIANPCAHGNLYVTEAEMGTSEVPARVEVWK